MNRDQFGVQQQANPVRGQQAREIGLRAVAAAVLYRGDASNVRHAFCRESPAPSDCTPRPSDRET